MKKIALIMFVSVAFVAGHAMDQAPQVSQEQMIQLSDGSVAPVGTIQKTLEQISTLDPSVVRPFGEACNKNGAVADETIFVVLGDGSGDEAWVEPVDVRSVLRRILIAGEPFVSADGVVHPLVRAIVLSFIQIQEVGDGEVKVINTFRVPESVASMGVDDAGAAAADADDEEESVAGAAVTGLAPGGRGLASLAGAVARPAFKVGGQRHVSVKHKKRGKGRGR